MNLPGILKLLLHQQLAMHFMVKSNVRYARTVSNAMGLKENNSQKDYFYSYPNPTNNKFTIIFKEAYTNANIKIQNSLRQTIKAIDITNSNHYNVDLSEFETGLYYVNISNETFSVVKKKKN